MSASSRWWLLVMFGFLSGCGLFAAPGQPCRKHEECDGLADGYCSRAEICTRECSESKTCPDNSTCVAQVKRSGVCLKNCESNSDCLKNFACVEGTCQVQNPLDPPPAN
jgi:hypothetical protein